MSMGKILYYEDKRGMCMRLYKTTGVSRGCHNTVTIINGIWAQNNNSIILHSTHRQVPLKARNES